MKSLASDLYMFLRKTERYTPIWFLTLKKYVFPLRPGDVVVLYSRKDYRLVLHVENKKCYLLEDGEIDGSKTPWYLFVKYTQPHKALSYPRLYLTEQNTRDVVIVRRIHE
jgi:hypothetical protein